jgi:hypothetical protein
LGVGTTTNSNREKQEVCSSPTGENEENNYSKQKEETCFPSASTCKEEEDCSCPITKRSSCEVV